MSPLSCHQIVGSIADPAAGPSYSVTSLANALSDRGGGDVSLWAVDGWRGQSQSVTLLPSVKLNIYRRNPGLIGKIACSSSSMRSALGKAAYISDIFHVHGLWLLPNVYPAWAIRANGTTAKLVISPRGMLGPAALKFSSLKKRLFWHLLQSGAVGMADCLHATSAAELSDIRLFGLKQPVAVIPNGIDIPSSPAKKTTEAAALRTVLSLGRIHPKKGLERLIRAWSAIERLHKGWQLRIVGPAELDHDLELRSIASSLGLKTVSIEQAVYGAAKAKVYQEADLFVLPTLNENFAMTVAEALAAQLPVIATTDAPWSGLRDEKCGWWVNPETDSLSLALMNAMSTPTDELRSMGMRGREWMKRDFQWDSVALKMTSLYEWLLQRAGRPDFVHLA